MLGRLDCLALDAEALKEQRIVRRRESLSPRPRHGAIAVSLARWAGDDAGCVLELRAVYRRYIPQNERAGIAAGAVVVRLDVEPDALVPFGKEAFAPATEPAE